MAGLNSRNQKIGDQAQSNFRFVVVGNPTSGVWQKPIKVWDFARKAI